MLPGVAGDDFTAGFFVRGGLHDEVLVRLDGLELYDPFHIKDLNGVFTIMDPQVIGGAELLPGAFPAEYGDRSTGVVDLVTFSPEALSLQLGVSFSNLWAVAAGALAEGRVAWLTSARYGYLDVILDLADEGDEAAEQPKPRYSDTFAKLDYQLTDHHRLALNTLVADDELAFEEVDELEIGRAVTSFGDRYLWASHQGMFGPRLWAETVLSGGQIEHDRYALTLDTGDQFLMTDRRDLELFGLRQDWGLALSDRWSLRAGFEARSFEVDFDYHDLVDREYPIDDPRFEASSDVTSFADRFAGKHLALYASSRSRLGKRLTAELGARYDAQTLVDAEQWSPRVNLVADLGRAGQLRLGWGHFFQSQHPHELDVSFGETELQSAQRAEHLTLGWEAELARLGLVRIEAYRRQERDPLPRYETLFDPFKPLPQFQIDLVRIDADRALSHGIELYLRGRRSHALDWWVSYVYSSVEDDFGRPPPAALARPAARHHRQHHLAPRTVLDAGGSVALPQRLADHRCDRRAVPERGRTNAALRRRTLLRRTAAGVSQPGRAPEPPRFDRPQHPDAVSRRPESLRPR